MSEVFIPPKAIEAARYALSCVYRPTASNLDDRIPEMNTAYERRFGPVVWRAAINRVLAEKPVCDDADDWRRAPWMPEFVFFKDVETGLPSAMLASRAEDLTTEDRAYLRNIDPVSLPPATVKALVSAAIDEEVRRAGL